MKNQEGENMRKLLSVILCVLVCFSLFGCQPTDKKPGGLSANLINVDFYAFNDMHGNVLDSDESTGGAGISKTTTYLKNYRGYNPNTVLLSSGDMWQGSAESNQTRGKLVTEWMNLNEFSAMTIGNHEFDWGLDTIKQNSELANFPFLGINVFDQADDQRVDFLNASTTLEFKDITVGIIGAIGDCYSSIAGSMVKDCYFKVGDELTELVKAESNKLRSEGADIIVYSLHDGYDGKIENEETIKSSEISSFYDVSLSEGYVDIVFEAHTHKSYVYKDEHGVYHVQGSSNNREIVHVDMDYDKKTGDAKVNRVQNVETKTLFVSDNSDTDALFDKYSAEIGDIYNVLGTNKTTIYSSDLEDLVASLYLETGLERWGDKYEIFLGGGFLRTRSPYNLKAGKVTYADLYKLFPFDNQIVLCSISGKYLKRNFINTTDDDYHSAYSAFGKQNKDSVDDNKTYYVIVDNYTSDYAYNHLTVVDRYESYFARDLLKDYIMAGKLA